MTNLFLIPLYNDWNSLKVLLKNINSELKKKKLVSEIIVINDCSNKSERVDIKKLKWITKVKIINLKKNLGSQKAIFVGLKYILSKNYKGILTILDSDGEDDVKKIIQLITNATNKPNSIILARRSQRTEGNLLKIMNQLRLFTNYLLTGNSINFGNFSSFNIDILKNLLTNNNLWVAYSGGVLKNYNNFFFINAKKQLRYEGSTKVNIYFLISHSINILSIFWKKIAYRSFLFFLFLFFLLSEKILIISIFLFLINILIFLNFKKNYKKFIKNNFLKNVNIYK